MLFSRITIFSFAMCLLAASFVVPSKAEAQRGRNGDSKDEKISFTNDVAPIIVAKCGKCHVSSSKGRYGIKSYDALMNSDSIEPRKPNDSYFIEVIENGDMPKGGLKVDDKELETLRQWIAEGAKFDGDEETDTISTSSGNSRGSRSSRARSGQSSSRTPGRRSSRSRSSRSSKPNAIESNKLMAFFDLDGNGKLSLKEIDAASRILRSLDANGDDRITGDELGEF